MRLLALLCAGCGRIAFDPTGDAASDTAGDTAGDTLPAQVTFGEGPGTTFSGVTADTSLWSVTPTVNYGRSVEASFQGDTHILLRFDVSAIPPGTPIIGARIDWFIAASGDITPGQVAARPITQPWDEGTLAAMPGTPNWVDRDTGMPWATAGGSFSATSVGTLNTTSSPGVVSVAIDPTIVQSWVDQPQGNLGLAFVTLSGHAHPRLSNSTTPGEQPVLTVDLQ